MNAQEAIEVVDIYIKRGVNRKWVANFVMER